MAFGGGCGNISVINNDLESCHFAQMSEARKAFLKGLAGKKKQVEKKTESKSLVPAKALNQSATPPKEEGGQKVTGNVRKGSDERVRFFAMLACKRPKKDPEAVVQPEPGPSQQATCVVFDLSSLHEFESRNLMNRDGDTKTERKRPNYDNRLRRLNMKHSARMAYLSFDVTRVLV